MYRLHQDKREEIKINNLLALWCNGFICLQSLPGFGGRKQIKRILILHKSTFTFTDRIETHLSPQYWSQILKLQLCARFILLHLPNFSAKSHSPYRGSTYAWNQKMSSTLRYDLPPRLQGGQGFYLFSLLAQNIACTGTTSE